jgi:hypothetical protein
VSKDVRYLAARRPSLDGEEQWGLYLPDEGRWVDIVFRTRREAERLIDEMRR